jgi:Site-specific recombinase XerD
MYKYGRVDIRFLQQILGHESVGTTEIYTHIDEHQLQPATPIPPGLP